MTQPRTLDYLGHIIDAAELAVSYVGDADRSAFMADRRTQQAVMLNLMIIGEAATQLAATDPEWVAQHPEIPWASMRGMRNRLAHGYFSIDLGVVWTTARSALPQLAHDLRSLRTTMLATD